MCAEDPMGRRVLVAWRDSTPKEICGRQFHQCTLGGKDLMKTLLVSFV